MHLVSQDDERTLCLYSMLLPSDLGPTNRLKLTFFDAKCNMIAAVVALVIAVVLFLIDRGSY